MIFWSRGSCEPCCEWRENCPAPETSRREATANTLSGQETTCSTSHLKPTVAVDRRERPCDLSKHRCVHSEVRLDNAHEMDCTRGRLGVVKHSPPVDVLSFSVHEED